ncbi:MAG: hypothetical protein AB7F65_08785 [Dehalococcoidia bacterium]
MTSPLAEGSRAVPAGLAEQRARLESERGRLQTERRAGLDLDRVERRLPEVLETIGRWCSSDGEDRLRLLVTALDVRLKASREMVEISGSVPLIDSADQTDLVTTARTSGLAFLDDQIQRVPFVLEVPVAFERP